jgi:general secretion pathway protein E
MSDPLSNGSGQQSGTFRSVNALRHFLNHLFDKKVMPIDASARLQLTMIDGTDKALQKLWQLSETPAQEFADEVASFFALPRIGLADLMSATSLVEKFSARFLRESSAFPCTSK